MLEKKLTFAAVPGIDFDLRFTCFFIDFSIDF